MTTRLLIDYEEDVVLQSLLPAEKVMKILNIAIIHACFSLSLDPVCVMRTFFRLGKTATASFSLA